MLLESLLSYFLYRRVHCRRGPLMAARAKAKGNKHTALTFCYDGPTLPMAAKEATAGCSSPTLQMCPFVQAENRQSVYTYSVLHASGAGRVVLLVSAFLP